MSFCSIPAISASGPGDVQEITAALAQINLATQQERSSPSFLVPDVLEHIFFFALPVVDETQNGGTLCSAPTNISQVNRHWRSTALSSRRLWSTLLVETNRLPVLTRHLSHFSLFLDRCGPHLNRPLDFSITSHPTEFVREKTAGRWSMRADVSEEVKTEGVSTVEGYLDLLLPRRSSWRNVRLALSTMAPASSADSKYWPWRIDNLSSIESLYLSYPPPENGVLGEPAVIDFSASEHLQKAHIRGHVNVHLSEGIKLDKLVFLRLDLIGKLVYYPADVNWFHFLQHAPNLETLNVSVCRGGPFMLLAEPVTLPRLNWLVVVNRGPEDLSPVFSFLPSIKCPALQCLEIVSRIRYPSFVLPREVMTLLGLGWFFQQSACPLLNLSIDSSIIDDDDLVGALSFVPTLRHLKIKHARVPETSRIVPYLAFDRVFPWNVLEDDPRCPDLETLTFQSCEFESRDCKPMVDMIAKRWLAEGSKLNQFNFGDCDLAGIDEHPVVKEFRSAPRYRHPRTGAGAV